MQGIQSAFRTCDNNYLGRDRLPSPNEKSDSCCPETPLRDNFSGYLTSVLPQAATTPSSMSSRMELLSVEYKTAGTRSMGSNAVNADKNILFISQWHQSIFVKIRNFTNRMTETHQKKNRTGILRYPGRPFRKIMKIIVSR